VAQGQQIVGKAIAGAPATVRALGAAATGPANTVTPDLGSAQPHL
jgi:hypothetical protein